MALEQHAQKDRFFHLGKAIGPVLPKLLLESLKLSQSVIHGYHRRSTAGFGSEFWQFRDHQPHDALRSIDWKRSAKLDPNTARSQRSHTPLPLLVRELEKETTQSIRFTIKFGPGMSWASRSDLDTKLNYASRLLFSIGFALERAGESFGWIDHPKLFTGPGALERVLLVPTQSWQNAFANVDRKISHIVVFTDGLDDLETHSRLVEYVSAIGHKISLILIEDPSERDFPFKGFVKFKDPNMPLKPSESSLFEQLIGKAQSVRDRYLEKRDAHFRAIKNSVHGKKGEMFIIPTDGDILDHLNDIVSSLRHSREVPRR